jgi:class 3 adenylate cyclase
MIIGAILALLIILPANFMAENLDELARKDFRHKLMRKYLLLQNDLLRFKLDLVPRYQIQRIINEVEKSAGLVALKQTLPNFSSKDFVEIYDQGMLTRILSILAKDHGLQPIYLGVASADVGNYWSWTGQPFSWLSQAKKELLDLNISCYITDLNGIDPVTVDKNAADNFLQRLIEARGSHKNSADAFYFSFREAFSEMAYSPRYSANTYEICCDRFDSLRLFVHYNRLKDREKFYGGYMLVFASRDLKPAFFLRKALELGFAGVKRAYSRESFTPSHLVLSSGMSSDLRGYHDLSSKKSPLPQEIFVGIDFSNEIFNLNKFRKSLSFVRNLAVLIAFFLMIRLFLFGITGFSQLRKSFLAVVVSVIFIPYLILGNLTYIIFGSLENLHVEEVKAELERYFYELDYYYHDQKIQHLIRLFYAKEQFIRNVNLSVSEFAELHAHEVVEPGFHANFYIYRNDAFTRKFDSGFRGSTRPNRFLTALGARYLEQIGALDKNKPAARKDLEISRLTDGFLSELREGNLEHFILASEGNVTRDIAKIDDFSRMVYFLIPENERISAPVKAIAFGNVADVNTNIYQQHCFHRDIFYRQSKFADAHLALGIRRGEGSVSRWWPDDVGVGNNLKRLLDLVALTNSNGQLLDLKDGRINLEGWRFANGDSSIFAGEIHATPDYLLELVIRVFPLLLLLFSIISIFLFSDVLNSMFVLPVQGFASAAFSIKAGHFMTRVVAGGCDELSELARSFNLMAIGLQQRESLRRFISEDLFWKIKQRNEELAFGKLQEKEVSVLASDIRSFTSISEKFPADEVVLLLNDYFTEMEAAIAGAGGVIVRFVGDAVVAVFQGNSPDKNCAAAVNAAVEMRKALFRLNHQRKNLGFFAVENGIGIATGVAVTGISGSQKGRKAFCVMGEVTQIAENLEAKSKNSNFNKIIICEKSAQLLQKKADLVLLKSDENFVEAYDFKGWRDD